MRALVILLASMVALPIRAAEKPVPVQDEPMHKTVFENDYARIIDVQVPPGETTLYHIHVIPSIVVYLTTSTNRSESWPDQTILTRDISAGQSRYAPYDEKPLTHRVTNTGAGLFRVFDIELLKKPSANAAPPTLATSQKKPHWDEKLARSSTVQLEPATKSDVAASSHAYLVVAIQGAVQVASAGAKPSAARTLKWGDYQFFPAQTRLEISNSAKEKAEVVLLELKH